MNKQQYLDAVDTLMREYDAFYFQNKYADFDKTTHAKEFKMLVDLLKDDQMSMCALSWICDCYDCYYRDQYITDVESPFAYLKQAINNTVKEGD